MPPSRVELSSIFQNVTQALAQNQQALDQADEYNRDHGSNMVQTFQTITNALEKKKGGSDSAALRYAAKQLEKSTGSGSGKLYAQSLSQAAAQFKGKRVDSRGALQLLQTLIGGGQSSQGGDLITGLLGSLMGQSASQSGGGDLLGALMGGLAGASSPQAAPAGGGDDLLGALMSGLAGSGAATGSQQAAPGEQAAAGSGSDLLGALMSGLAGSGAGAGSQQAAQAGGGSDLLGALVSGLAGGGAGAGSGSGGNLLGSLAQAFLSGSGMGRTTHREQSTQVVVNSFLQALGSAGVRR